jgi:hypothetical protein
MQFTEGEYALVLEALDAHRQKYSDDGDWSESDETNYHNIRAKLDLSMATPGE